ncbi:gliding motility protein [Streptomyces roseoviridis]|uniref:Gliding motility protein n=1 Tax=Streptomyces roseoviridis TaxID=67361 RepID=A0ABV5QW64_9ACTN
MTEETEAVAGAAEEPESGEPEAAAPKATEAGDAGADTGAKGEAVEIPKQQSAEEAADNEAGEGARA